ncbi:MAG: acylphosphatase [Cyclobacteriaceae bacterium]
MISRRIQVLGKVQGVFYRATAKTKADDLRLVGWVRNEPDGSVVLEVQGDDAKVSQMIEWCKEGPTFSRVDQVLEEPAEPISEKSFEIVY